MTDGIHTVLIVNDEAAHWQGYRDRLARESGAESVQYTNSDAHTGE